MLMLLIPYVCAGPFKFGMTQERIRKVVDCPYEVWDGKNSVDGIPIDIFEIDTEDGPNQCVHVEYKNPGIIQAVELWYESDPIFGKKHLLRMPYNETVKFLLSVDKTGRLHDGGGFVFPELGFIFERPSPLEENTKPARSMLVFERGYYGSL